MEKVQPSVVVITGSYYGMSRDQFGALSFDEQMKYVERYYKDRGFDGTKNAHWPMHIPPWLGMAIKGSKAYELNRVWDTDGNGVIDKGEAVRAPSSKLTVRNGLNLKRSH
jgi:hypothetical protein